MTTKRRSEATCERNLRIRTKQGGRKRQKGDGDLLTRYEKLPLEIRMMIMHQLPQDAVLALDTVHGGRLPEARVVARMVENGFSEVWPRPVIADSGEFDPSVLKGWY